MIARALPDVVPQEPPPPGSIVVAHDVTTDTVHLHRFGGGLRHRYRQPRPTARSWRAFWIPAVVGLAPSPAGSPPATCGVDSSRGFRDPSAPTTNRSGYRFKARAAQHQLHRSPAHRSRGARRDHRPPASASWPTSEMPTRCLRLDYGAEGIGLYRTNSFIDRNDLPRAEEHFMQPAASSVASRPSRRPSAPSISGRQGGAVPGQDGGRGDGGPTDGRPNPVRAAVATPVSARARHVQGPAPRPAAMRRCMAGCASCFPWSPAYRSYAPPRPSGRVQRRAAPQRHRLCPGHPRRHHGRDAVGCDSCRSLGTQG